MLKICGRFRKCHTQEEDEGRHRAFLPPPTIVLFSVVTPGHQAGTIKPATEVNLKDVGGIIASAIKESYRSHPQGCSPIKRTAN